MKLPLLLPLLILLSACAFGADSDATRRADLVFTAGAQTRTAAAQTVQADLTRIAAQAQDTPTPVSTIPATALPGFTPAPSPAPGQPTSTLADETCDRAAFVEDITIPDGTLLEPGETFVKTWRLKNTGTCTWTSGYLVVFDEGDALGAPASFPLTTGEVNPGEEVDISVELTAPEEPGTYRGDWKLRNPAGAVFGLGSKGTASFWVLIKVGAPPNVTLLFDNIHPCEGAPTAIFSLANNGEQNLESAEITLIDRDSGNPVFGPLAHDGPFMGAPNECPPGGDALKPGKTGFLGASLENTNSGQKLTARFTICNQDALGGMCTEETLDFTVP